MHRGKQGAMHQETHADQHVQLALMRMDMDDDDDDDDIRSIPELLSGYGKKMRIRRSASSALLESTTNLHR